MTSRSPVCSRRATPAPTSGSSPATRSSSRRSCSEPRRLAPSREEMTPAMDGLYEQLRIALHQVWKRRWLALAVAWGLCLVGWLVVALIPNRYESVAHVFVQAQSLLPTQVGITPQDCHGTLVRLHNSPTPP